MTSHAARLSDRAVLCLSGPDAKAFLQGLVTSDMEACAPGYPIYTALLTPQGKILFEFFVIDAGDTLLIDCGGALADDLVKRLTMYKLRAKVDIARAPLLAVRAGWSDDTDLTLEGGVYADPRYSPLGWRAITPATPGADERSLADYERHRIALGVPGTADLKPDTVFPLDAGFEELHGISLKKGCFVGQEVAARMKHRATSRKRPLIAEIDGVLPPPGTPVLAGSREIGTLATGEGNRALAFVRLDKWAEVLADNASLSAAGARTVLHAPPWLTL